jgi:phosphoserine phosphatase
MENLEAVTVRHGLARAADAGGAPLLGRAALVVQKLLSHFDLDAVLGEIVATAQTLFGAELAALWLYAPERRELTCSIPRQPHPVTIASGVGLVGECARAREVLNVADVTADARFAPAVDGAAQVVRGSMLNLPLVDADGALVGVLQLLDEDGLPFDARAVATGQLLAALAAVALRAVKLHVQRLEHQRLQQEVELARSIQMSTLPSVMPEVPGYAMHGHFQPAEQAGGDLYDLVLLDGKLFVLLGDATGHGFGPALSATQMQAMLRTAFRCGADLDTACVQVNNQLCEDLPDNRFITAFMGLLDPSTHRVRFHSGGQGPILHWQAATNAAAWHAPTTFPFGAMPIDAAPPAAELELAPGDLLAVISDGVYEYADANGALFGDARVAGVFERWHALPLPALTAKLLQAAAEFAHGAPQLDDITVVLVRRLP